MSKCYLVMATQDVTQAHINMSTSNFSTSPRTNDNNLKSILEFNSTDNLAREIFKDQIWYTRDEIKKIILQASEWNNS